MIKEGLIKRETKRRLETERRIQHIKEIRNESEKKKHEQEEKWRDRVKEQRKNATDLEKEEIQNRPTTKNKGWKNEKEKRNTSRLFKTLQVNWSF